MDPLSITTAVVALVGAAAKIVTVSSSIISNVRERPRLLNDALKEVKNVERCLAMLQSFLDGTKSIDPANKTQLRLHHLSVIICDTQLTLLDLEKLLDRLTGMSSSSLRRAIEYELHGELVAKHLVKLQRHKTNLSLVLDILQAESQLAAQQAMYTLSGRVDRFLQHHGGFAQRFAEMELPLDVLGALGRSNFGEDSLDVRQDSSSSGARTFLPWAADRTTAMGSTARHTAHGVHPFRHEFEEVLHRSRVYRKCHDNVETDKSFATSGVWSNALTALAALTLADVSSNLSVIALPLTLKDVEEIGRTGLDVSAHDIFSGTQDRRAPVAVFDTELPSAITSTTLEDAQAGQKSGQWGFFSRSSSETADGRSSGFWRSRRSSRSSLATSTPPTISDYLDRLRGIDHVDRQPSVMSLSEDYDRLLANEPWIKSWPVTPEGYEEMGPRSCYLCRQPDDSFGKRTSLPWICGPCFTAEGV